MALPGELAGLDGVDCECGQRLNLTVLSTPAGFYLGYFCPCCGPYSRETGYYPSRKIAEEQLLLALGGYIPEKIRY